MSKRVEVRAPMSGVFYRSPVPDQPPYVEVGDTVMGMNLAQGGHLTHGLNVNFSGKLYNFVHYGVDRETELLDYDEMAVLAREHKPKLIISGASAYPRTIDFDKFSEIASSVKALHMADIAHICLLYTSPSPRDRQKSRMPSSA